MYSSKCIKKKNIYEDTKVIIIKILRKENDNKLSRLILNEEENSLCY